MLGVAYNFLSVYISKHLNAAVFVVLDSLKPITIWSVLYVVATLIVMMLLLLSWTDY